MNAGDQDGMRYDCIGTLTTSKLSVRDEAFCKDMCELEEQHDPYGRFAPIRKGPVSSSRSLFLQRTTDLPSSCVEEQLPEVETHL